MRIWKEDWTLERLNHGMKGTIHDSLGIEFIAIGDDFLEATLPVDERTKQPLGLLHGGASAVLAESLGSRASALVAGEGYICVGIELSASHLKSARQGSVIGRVRPIRLGKTVHVWEIQIRKAAALDSALVCLSRLTVLVRELNKKAG